MPGAKLVEVCHGALTLVRLKHVGVLRPLEMGSTEELWEVLQVGEKGRFDNPLFATVSTRIFLCKSSSPVKAGVIARSRQPKIGSDCQMSDDA